MENIWKIYGHYGNDVPFYIHIFQIFLISMHPSPSLRFVAGENSLEGWSTGSTGSTPNQVRPKLCSLGLMKLSRII